MRWCKDKRWARLRATALRKSKQMCALCVRYGKRKDAKAVHHIYPRSEYPEYTYCAWNLIPLCRGCHNAMHTRHSDGLTMRGEKLKNATIPPTLRL